MAKRKTLTPQQLLFIDEYLKSSNATAAYIHAYYINQGKEAPNSSAPRACASRLLASGSIKRAIGERLAERARETGKIADPFELAELNADIIRFDPIDAFAGETNELLPIPKMPTHVRRCISGFTIREITRTRGQGESQEIEHEVKTDLKFYDKQTAAAWMGDVYGLKKNGTPNDLMIEALKQKGLNITINQTINNDNRQIINDNTVLMGKLKAIESGPASASE